MTDQQPTPRQIALAVAALQEWVYSERIGASNRWRTRAYMFADNDRLPDGKWDSPIAALAAAAEALGLEPDPSILPPQAEQQQMTPGEIATHLMDAGIDTVGAEDVPDGQTPDFSRLMAAGSLTAWSALLQPSPPQQGVMVPVEAIRLFEREIMERLGNLESSLAGGGLDPDTERAARRNHAALKALATALTTGEGG